MLKGVLIFLGLLALSSAAVLYADAPTTCVYTDQAWAAEDPRQYYFCLNNVPISTECDEGSYYVNNATVSGCIPAQKMDPSCVNLDVTVGPCTGINLKQPQASQVLTNFYLCPEENGEPVELTCTDDKAFVKQDGYLGCFDWTFWRQLRDCN